MTYRIVENFGGGKLWRIDHNKHLAEKTLANTQNNQLAKKLWRLSTKAIS